MNKYVIIAKIFISNILSTNYTSDSLKDLLEIQSGNTEVLLEHLKAVNSIINKAIIELESENREK